MEGTPPPGGPYRPTEGQPPHPGPYEGQPTGVYQAPPPGYQQQQPYGAPRYDGQQQGGGPGFGERAQEAAQSVGRQWRTPETKPFFRTSEFLVWVVTVVGLLIAGAVVDNGDNGDGLGANTVWTLITVISFAYIVSRGVSKAGTRYRDGDSGRHGGY